MKNLDGKRAFSKHLKALRKKYNLSQQELADRSDVDKRAIQKIEMGDSNPKLDTLLSLAFGFEITLKELMDFKYNARKQ